MNNHLAKYSLRTITYLRNQPLWKSLGFLEASQWWNAGKIEEYQQRKLASLLQFCYENVEFYRTWFQKSGYKPSDIGLENLHLLPAIDKMFLRNNLDRLTAQNYKGAVEHAKTSGSTGISLHFPKSLDASAMQLAAMYRGHGWHGVEPGAREARLWGIPVNRYTRIKTKAIDILLNRFREKEYNLKIDTLKDFQFRMKKYNPVYLMGYTSMVREFALFLKNSGLDGKAYNLKMAKCTSETIVDSDWELIDEVFGCPLVSEYGAAETGIISFQCEQGCHHIMSDCCIVEFTEPEENPGDPSLKELIITNLDNYALPIIRYRIDDLAVPSKTICNCGRQLPLIKKIVGRTSNVIRASDGSRWHSIILYYIMKGLVEKFGGVVQFKAIQKKLDQIDLLLVPEKTFGPEVENYLREEFLHHFGSKMKVRIRLVDVIEREPSGKLRDFVSEI